METCELLIALPSFVSERLRRAVFETISLCYKDYRAALFVEDWIPAF